MSESDSNKAIMEPQITVEENDSHTIINLEQTVEIVLNVEQDDTPTKPETEEQQEEEEPLFSIILISKK